MLLGRYYPQITQITQIRFRENQEPKASFQLFKLPNLCNLRNLWIPTRGLKISDDHATGAYQDSFACRSDDH